MVPCLSGKAKWTAIAAGTNGQRTLSHFETVLELFLVKVRSVFLPERY